MMMTNGGPNQSFLNLTFIPTSNRIFSCPPLNFSFFYFKKAPKILDYTEMRFNLMTLLDFEQGHVPVTFLFVHGRTCGCWFASFYGLVRGIRDLFRSNG